MKHILLILLLSFTYAKVTAQTIYESVQTGNWEDLATWTTITYQVVFIPPSTIIVVPTPGPATQPPTAADYATIKDNHVVTINSAAEARLLTVYSTDVATPAKLVVSAGNSLTADTVSMYPVGSGVSNLENNGTVTAVKTSFTLASATSVANIVNNSIYTTTTTDFSENQGLCKIIINGGARYTTTDVNTDNTVPANTIFDLSSGNGVLRIKGAFNEVGAGDHPTIVGGTSGSRVEYRGTTPQVINTSYASFQFYDLRVYNSAGVSLDAPLTSTNLARDLALYSPGVFNQNGQSIDVARNITVNSGTTFNSDATINVVNRLTNSGTFNFTGGNTLSIGQNLVNTGTFNATGLIDITGSFTNDNGTFVSSGCNINVERNWSNSGGTYTYQTGDVVTLDGIGANSNFAGTTEFYELNITKAGKRATVGAGDVVNIKGILDVDAGELRITTGEVTLLSDASGTAQLDVLEAGATFSGALNVQRYLALGNDGWREVTSPVQGTTLADWQNDGVVFTGFPGADYNGTNWYSWVNSYTYNEPNANGVKYDGWVASTNITDVTSPTKGHRIYMGNGGSLNLTLSVKGTPNTGLQMIPITNGGSGASDDQNGWNLIGNPYPCTVDWNSVATSNTESAYWIWNATAGNYGVYQNGQPNGTNGVNQYIAHSQAFWVHATAASGSVIFSETNKVRNDKAFVKSNAIEEFVRIKLSSAVNSYSDEAILTFHESATTNFDNGLDQYKLYTDLDDLAPSLAIVTDDNIDLSIAGINELVNRTIPIKAFAGTTAYGTYTIEFTLPANALQLSCVTLEDLETGTITNIKDNPSYTFTTTANSPQTRFLLHISQPFETEVMAGTCYGSNDGAINVSGTNLAGETISITDEHGVTTSQVVTGGSVVFDNLPAGTYTVLSSQANSCGQSSIDVTVVAPEEVVAAFQLQENVIYLDENPTITLTNASIGTSYTWDFGDGSVSYDETPTHTYMDAGVYTITLTVENENGCSSTTSQTVEVKSTTAINEIEELGFSTINTANGILVTLKDYTNNSTLTLTDINGKVLKTYTVNGNQVLIQTNRIAKGLYFITLDNTSSKTIIVE